MILWRLCCDDFRMGLEEHNTIKINQYRLQDVSARRPSSPAHKFNYVNVVRSCRRPTWPIHPVVSCFWYILLRIMLKINPLGWWYYPIEPPSSWCINVQRLDLHSVTVLISITPIQNLQSVQIWPSILLRLPSCPLRCHVSFVRSNK